MLKKQRNLTQDLDKVLVCTVINLWAPQKMGNLLNSALWSFSTKQQNLCSTSSGKEFVLQNQTA